MSTAPNDRPQLTSALWYASLGWSVVPTHKVVQFHDGTMCTCPSGVSCISKGKHPAVGWAQYQQQRPDEAQLRTWFEGAFSTYGVGVITGAVSGIFVVDVDEAPGKSGGETINDLQMIHGDLPFTVQARTGGGGRHILFRHPRDVWITTGRNTLGPGVDTRGDGGFIVVSPSLHESGRYYLWDEVSHPRTTPLADAPAWVVELS
jgi:putative DNA primase/helicase